MALVEGDQQTLEALRQQVNAVGDKMLMPTPEEIEDAATFLHIAKFFLDKGYHKLVENKMQSFGETWIKHSRPGIWKCYTGIALFGGVVNLASLEAMMHYAYLIIFASGRNIVWKDELIAIMEEPF